jgi:hypothetical protein
MWLWLASAALAAELRTCGDVPAGGCYATLAEAVDGSAPGDVITLAEGEYFEAITITHDLTLVGEPGHALLDPPDVESVVTVLGGHVTLDGLLIMSTRARAVEVTDASLEIRDGAFESTGVQYLGGIVRAERSTLAIDGGEFHGGTAFQGGQIAARESAVAIEGSVHDGGQATHAGGCIALGSFSGEAEEVSLTAVTVRGCRAAVGGGIVLFGVDARLQNVEALENEADEGAGVLAGDTNVVADGLWLYGNVASELGGGMAATVEERPGSLAISRSLFELNTSGVTGGGLWSRVPTTLSITRFIGNGSGTGGGAYAEDLRGVQLSRFCSNTGWSSGSALDAKVTVDAEITNTLFAANYHESWAEGPPVALRAGEGVRIGLRFDTFVYNQGSTASALDLTDAALATVDVSSSVLAGNVALRDGTWTVRTAGAAHTFRYDVWHGNVGEGDLPEGWPEEGAVVGDPALDRWNLNNCQWGLTAGLDPGLPSPGGAGIDAGDPAYTDGDQTRADAGHYAGPAGDVQLWLDHDGDGTLTAYDCDWDYSEVHPGAWDEPYDGVDMDCGFDSDYDADRDGHDSEAWGGDDCADDDPTRSPSAEDVPNDGIDQDCAGGDVVDVDGDGWIEGPDCDDHDAAVNPGQTDADGDQDLNCDGYAGPLRPRTCATASPTGLAALVALLALSLRRRARAWAVAAGVAAAGSAEAAPACEPLDEAAFRSLVLDAQAAVDRDDAALHEAIVTDALSRVPCMTFAPPPRLWADFLVNVALVEFVRGGDWHPAMAAALRIRPGVDRGVGAGHPMQAWEPPEALPGTAPVPEGAVVWVDGVRAAVLPPADGLYLVQREVDGRWASRLLLDQAVDPAWLAERIVVRPTLERWAGASLRLAGSASAQQTSWDTPYVLDTGWGASHQGAEVRVGGWYGRFGGELEAMTSLRDFAPPAAWAARVAAVARSGAFAAGPGAGITSVTASEGDATHVRRREIATPWVFATAWHRPPTAVRWDEALVLGGGPALARAELRAGYTSGETPRLRVGATLGAQRAWMVQAGDADRLVEIDHVWLAVEIGAFAGAW